MIYKLGDRGSVVRLIQEALKKYDNTLVADGIFGEKTAAAVRKYQEANKLDVDAIVGPQTLNVLFGRTELSSDSDIVMAPLYVHVSKCSTRTPKYLCIHYTAGGSSKPGSALAVKKVFEKRSASADFATDDRDMVQFNPDIAHYYCWAVGDGNGKFGITNSNSISIEMCSTLKSNYHGQYPMHEGWSISEATFKNTVKLAKILMKKYSIPLDRVVRHYDASLKKCPGCIGWLNVPVLDHITGKATGKQSNDAEWKRFKEALKNDKT